MFFYGLLSSFHDIFVSHGVIFRKFITFILKHYVVQSVFIGILNWATILVAIYHILGAVSIRKTVLPGMAIPMLKIRRPNGRLIFNMEIAIRR